MIIAHYGHRLPADYNIGLIHARARERGPLWNAVPELYFKAFLLRESGRFGATTNSYSSLYLWRQDEAFRNFLVKGGYKIVVDLFGRAAVETRFALDARKGPGEDARLAYRQDIQIALDADLETIFAAEIERNREAAERAGVVAAAVGVDVLNWQITRVVVSDSEHADAGTSHQILHLARPLLSTLHSSSE
jgi:hypothetical protein